jgi:hypothetical protein
MPTLQFFVSMDGTLNQWLSRPVVGHDSRKRETAALANCLFVRERA